LDILNINIGKLEAGAGLKESVLSSHEKPYKQSFLFLETKATQTVLQSPFTSG